MSEPGDSVSARETPAASTPLRVLTLNMQVGMPTDHYGHYVTGAWRHLLPSRSARQNLPRIAELLRGYDIVALQEADAGSLRSGRINQIEFLAQHAGFSHWHAAVNRNLSPLAQHAIGVLSRHPLHDLRHHPLPGRLPGRGAIAATVQLPGHAPLQIVIAHLSLGRGSRLRQLDYLSRLAQHAEHSLLMGDFNCDPAELDAHPTLQSTGFRVLHREPTYPSWRPRRSIDHLLANGAVTLDHIEVLPPRVSDHLAVAATLRLPPR